jgi:hypothetical protein
MSAVRQKAKKRHRPVLQWKPEAGIDPRTRTRVATPEEITAAKAMLDDLEKHFLSVTLVPAPVQNTPGQMVRAVQNRNPEWYSKFFKNRREQVKRVRIVQALMRVVSGRVRGNGYETELLMLHNQEVVR